MSDITLADQSAEKKIRAFIDAAVLSAPDLKDRLNVAACVQYLQLPDSTYGWTDKNEKMPIEFKLACLLPTIINGLPAGSIFWLGNRPYASAAALSFVAARDVKALSGITFRAFTPEEKSMYGIGDKDLAVVAQRDVVINGIDMKLEGFGVLGWDESQPNKYGNHKVATEKTRDRMQFVRTRAIRDMWNRHISIAGVPSEDDYYSEHISVSQDERPSAVAQLNGKHPENSEANINDALLLKEQSLIEKVNSMGGNAAEIADNSNLAIRIKLLEEWIEANKKPDPEPPVPPKRQRKKAEPEKPKDPPYVTRFDEPVDIMNRMADDITKDEYDGMDGDESQLDEFDIPEHLEPKYVGSDDQKKELKAAVVAAGLPHSNGILHAVAASMSGQPMTKLQSIVAEFKVDIATPPPEAAKRATEAERIKLKQLIEKITKIGGKTIDICGENPWKAWESGDADQIKATTAKLEAWYAKLLKAPSLK